MVFSRRLHFTELSIQLGLNDGPQFLMLRSDHLVFTVNTSWWPSCSDLPVANWRSSRTSQLTTGVYHPHKVIRRQHYWRIDHVMISLATRSIKFTKWLTHTWMCCILRCNSCLSSFCVTTARVNYMRKRLIRKTNGHLCNATHIKIHEQFLQKNVLKGGNFYCDVSCCTYQLSKWRDVQVNCFAFRIVTD